jgi:hypothetical protein
MSLRRRSISIGQRDRSEHRNLLDGFPTFLLITSIAIHGYLILLGNGQAPMYPMDQGFVYVDLHIYHNGTNWIFQYPHLSWAGGITGSLIVGLYKLLIPTSVETLNWHVKILSATLFLVSVFLLARAYKLDLLSQAAVLAIVSTSGLLHLEPSTELFAGASLNFFATTIRSASKAVLQGVLLAVFSLIKVELLPVGLGVAVFWAVASVFSYKSTAAFLTAFFICLAGFLAPEFYLYGIEELVSNRSFNAFYDSYCALFHPGSIANCLQIYMPDAHSVRDVIQNHTAEYLAFLGAATIQSFREILFALNLVAFSPLLIFRHAFAPGQRDDQNLTRITLLVLTLTFAVTIPFTYIHPRYLTKLLGLLVVSGFLGLRAISAKKWAVIGVTLLVVAGNLWHFRDFLAAPHSH